MTHYEFKNVWSIQEANEAGADGWQLACTTNVGKQICYTLTRVVSPYKRQ